jgi:hypothetical protein
MTVILDGHIAASDLSKVARVVTLSSQRLKKKHNANNGCKILT